MDPKNYASIRTRDPVKWETSFSNKIDRLAQGVSTHMKNEN